VLVNQVVVTENLGRIDFFFDNRGKINSGKINRRLIVP
jgi:hypothetical protein